MGRREETARRCDGKGCGSGRRRGPAVRRRRPGEPGGSGVASQRRAAAAAVAPLLIAPGAAAGGGWIQRPWRRRRRRRLPSDPRQRLPDCSPYAGDMGTRQPLPSLGVPSPGRGPGSAGLRPSPLLGRLAREVSALRPGARGPVSGCRAGSSSLPSFLCHSAQAAATAAAQARIRPGRGLLCARRAVCAAAEPFPAPPSPFLLVLRLLPPPPSLTPPSAPPPA